MKTKLKYFSLAIAALLMVGFASCSSDDEPTMGVDENEMISVMLKLDLGPTTRAEVAPIAADTKATFSKGHIYFTTATGSIVRHYTIGNSATGDKNIQLSDLTTGDGRVVTGLPGNTTQIYVFGNTSDEVSLPTSGPINNVKAMSVTLASQSDIKNVNLYGTTSTFKETSAGNPQTGVNAVYTATVSIKPTVARLELGKLVSSHNIASFKVKGIFIDNYYKSGNVDGTTVAGNLKSLTTGAYDSSEDGDYKTAENGVNFDWYGDAELISTVLDPEVDYRTAEVKLTGHPSKVWGYNLFAGHTAIPRMVIRMTAVTPKTGASITFEDPSYLTVKGFVTAGEGAAPVTQFEQGYVYKIVEIVFRGSNLSATPNLVDKEVTVKVEVTPWTVQEIKPIL